MISPESVRSSPPVTFTDVFLITRTTSWTVRPYRRRVSSLTSTWISWSRVPNSSMIATPGSRRRSSRSDSADWRRSYALSTSEVMARVSTGRLTSTRLTSGWSAFPGGKSSDALDGGAHAVQRVHGIRVVVYLRLDDREFLPGRRHDAGNPDGPDEALLHALDDILFDFQRRRAGDTVPRPERCPGRTSGMSPRESGRTP